MRGAALAQCACALNIYQRIRAPPTELNWYSTCGLSDPLPITDKGMSRAVTSHASGGSPIFHVVQSWGVASARHTSGCIVYPHPSTSLSDDGGKKKDDCISPPSSQDPIDDSCIHTEYMFDVPIGPLIVRWDFQTKKRVLQFQAHCDVVTSMRMSPDRRYIATSCFSGEVKLWSPQWVCLDHVTAPMTSQYHLAWSHDSRRFLVVGNGHNSSVVVYDIIYSDPDKDTPRLKEAWRVRAGQRFDTEGDHHHKSSDNATKKNDQEEGAGKTQASISCKNSGLEYQYGDAFYMAEINPSGNIFAVEERPEKNTLAKLYSPSGELLNASELCTPTAGDCRAAVGTRDKGSSVAGSDGDGGGGKRSAVQTLLISTFKDGCYALVAQGGYVLFVDAEQLTISKSFKVGYSCRTCVWDGDSLVLPSDSGKLVWWSQTGDKLASFSVGTSDYVVRLEWSVSGKALWMCGFSIMTCLNVKRSSEGVVESVSQLYMIPSHSIACCGAGFSPNGWSLASGDLAGNVWITEQEAYQPKHMSTVSASVRCIVWRSDTVMLIGCLDGCVYQWKVDGTTKDLLHLEGSVLHMQADHQLKLLAVGTSKGVLTIYDTTSKEADDLKLITSFLAHPPQPGPQNPRFGQLGLQAEIWSLCWSPHDIMVATSSEDQTTKIWKATEWTCIATLRGHSMAVTSVDWKLIGRQTIIATCADDRTVRLTCGESFDLIRVLDTKDIFGWHTLTYLAFQPTQDSTLLVCTTQNGHVVVWDGATGERLARGKMHLGSIEGLAWQNSGSCLATVGADCVVNMFQLSLNL